MSIEDKIQGLTTSIVNLTNALSSTKTAMTNLAEAAAPIVEEETNIVAKKEEAKEEKAARKSRKAKETEVTKDSQGNSNVTSDEVLALAKVKAVEVEGNRKIIKDKTTELGAEKISELSQEALNTLYDFLTGLTASKTEEDL